MNGTNPEQKTDSGSRRPIVVDLGKRKGRAIRELREGRGPLVGEALETVRQVRAELGESASEQTPIVLLYERRRKRKGGSVGCPFFMMK